MSETQEELFTREHVASILKVNVRTVDRLIRQYHISIVKFNTLVRIPKTSLDTLLKTLTVKGGE